MPCKYMKQTLPASISPTGVVLSWMEIEQSLPAADPIIPVYKNLAPTEEAIVLADNMIECQIGDVYQAILT